MWTGKRLERNAASEFRVRKRPEGERRCGASHSGAWLATIGKPVAAEARMRPLVVSGLTTPSLRCCTEITRAL